MPAGGDLEVRVLAGIRHVGVLGRGAPGNGDDDPEEKRTTPDEALDDAVGLVCQEVRPPRKDYVVSKYAAFTGNGTDLPGGSNAPDVGSVAWNGRFFSLRNTLERPQRG